MSERFEQSIKDWYQNSRTVDLEYLNLESKVSLEGISNNIGVVYDKLLLHSKVSISKYKSILEVLKQNHLETSQALQESLKHQRELQQAVLQLQKEILLNKPLTVKDVRSLVLEISKQPRILKEHASNLIGEIKSQIKQIEEVMKEVKRRVS